MKKAIEARISKLESFGKSAPAVSDRFVARAKCDLDEAIQAIKQVNSEKSIRKSAAGISNNSHSQNTGDISQKKYDYRQHRAHYNANFKKSEDVIVGKLNRLLEKSEHVGLDEKEMAQLDSLIHDLKGC